MIAYSSHIYFIVYFVYFAKPTKVLIVFKPVV